MIQPRSLKAKLQLWVVIIFLLTGTAGWAGIWGLFYFRGSGHDDQMWMLQLALFVLVLLCQGFSAWAGWQFSRTLTGELNALKESAEKISMGDLKSAVTVRTTDVEIVALGQALDRLRVSLGKAMERLARRPSPSQAPPPPLGGNAQPAA